MMGTTHESPFSYLGFSLYESGDRHCSTVTKLMRPGHGLSLMTWVVGYEHVTQRAHIVCSRVRNLLKGHDVFRTLLWLHILYFLLISSPSWRRESYGVALELQDELFWSTSSCGLQTGLSA